MLLACDGIWDVLSNAEACALVRTLLMEVREFSAAADRSAFLHTTF